MSDDDDLRQAVASIDDAMAFIGQMHRENEELRARIVELEAMVTLLRGSINWMQPAPDTPMQITHNLPPDAPR
jgi:cell division protein FtsB